MRRMPLMILALAQLHCAMSFAQACAPHDTIAGAVTVVPVTLGNVPALLRIPGTISLPPILLWHGFGPPDNTNDLMGALPLDDVPSVKVYLGLPLFGARAASGTATVAQRQSDDYVTQLFEPAIIGAATELPSVIEELRARHCMGRTEGVGLFGFSAGGAAVLYALAEHRVNIRAAVMVNTPINLTETIAAVERVTGHAYVWTATAKHIAAQSDAIRRAADIASTNPPPALLLLQGANDAVVAPAGASAFRDALGPLYHAKGADRRFRVEVLPGVSHRWTESPSVDSLRRESGAWFNSFMTAD
jgi:predicted esterase